MSHGERVLSLVHQNPPLCPDVVCRVVEPPVSGGGARQFDLDRPALARRKFQDQVDFSACVCTIKVWSRPPGGGVHEILDDKTLYS